jgi:hypothetical protein
MQIRKKIHQAEEFRDLRERERERERESNRERENFHAARTEYS